MRRLVVLLAPLCVPVLFGLGAACQVRAAAYNSSVLFSIPESSSLSGAAGGQFVGFDLSFPFHAGIWSSSGVVDLHPSGFTVSYAQGTDGTRQVGEGYGSSTRNIEHALLWTGTAASAVDLHPTNLRGFTASFAYGIEGMQQVGRGFGSVTGNRDHALLWTGTAASAVDLNPSGFTSSIAYATSGTQQVGAGTASGGPRALLWSGTAASAVDLHPTNLSGIQSSGANGIGGTQQVGYGYGYNHVTGGFHHALLWSGTAESAVDLHPTNLFGFTGSFANDTNGARQVGTGFGTAGDFTDPQALLWSGTAASAVNLQLLLPESGAWISSNTYSIDDAGNVLGWAYGTYGNHTGSFAVRWSPIPEPDAVCLAAIGLLGTAVCSLRGNRSAKTS